MILKKYNFNKLLINFFTDEEIKEIKEKETFGVIKVESNSYN